MLPNFRISLIKLMLAIKKYIFKNFENCIALAKEELNLLIWVSYETTKVKWRAARESGAIPIEITLQLCYFASQPSK